MLINIETIKKKALSILKENDVGFAAVFGSYAKGQATEKSDIDLMIKFSKPKSLIDLVSLEGQLSDLLGIKVDLITEKAISPYLKEEIFSTLIPLL